MDSISYLAWELFCLHTEIIALSGCILPVLPVTVKQGNISPLQPDSLTEYHTAFVHTTSDSNHNQSAYYGQYSCNNCRRLADNV